MYLYGLSNRAIVPLEILVFLQVPNHTLAPCEPHSLILQSLTIPLFIASRVPQIVENFKTKNTGALSAITWTLNFVGSLGTPLAELIRTDRCIQLVFSPLCRRPTTLSVRIMRTANVALAHLRAVLAGYVIGTVLNGIIMMQVFSYKDGKKAVKKKTQ